MKIGKANEVRVYDWDGKLVRKLILNDYAAQSIAVQGGKFYTKIEDPDSGYGIVEYEIPR